MNVEMYIDAQSNWLAKFYKMTRVQKDTNFVWAGRDVNRSDGNK